MGGVVRWRLVRVYWSYVTLHASAHKGVAQIARYCVRSRGLDSPLW